MILLMVWVFMHGNRIFHRDLKSPNILIDDAGRVKITDFGLSKYVEASITHVTSVTGSPCWTAPEILLEQDFREGSDTYSFVGVILWESIKHEKPWGNKNSLQVSIAILNGQTLMSFVLPNELPVEIYELLRQCLDYTQQTRPSFEIIKDRLKEYLENNQLPIMKVEDDTIPDSYICPITFAPMIDPVMCADVTYL
jgi:serine/threonine protein kinase